MEFVLKDFKMSNLAINPDKCRFGCTQVQYLGYLLYEERLRPDPEKIEAVRNYTTPTNVKQVRIFLGRVN